MKDKDFYKKIISIAVPVTLQSLITISVNLADTAMLGSFGEAQLSASSLANQFYSLFSILCMGVGGGAAVMTSQYWGRGDIPALKKTITIMFRIITVLSLLFMAVTLLFPGEIMSVYTPEADLIENGKRYFSFLAFTYPLFGLSMTATIVLRSFGAVKIPLFSSIFSFGVNIFFNWVFIFGHLGAPRMEIAGAALGTLISRIFEFAFIIGYLFFVDKKIRYRLKDLFLSCSAYWREYIRYSIPVVISDFLLALGNNMVAVIVGRLGSSFVSANAITTMTVQLTTVFGQGMAMASSILTGNTLGRGETEKAYRQGVTLVTLSAIMGVFASILLILINPFVISFYNITDETLAIAQQLMAAVAFNTIFHCMSSVLTKGVLRGGGDTRFLMLADILFLWAASIPLGMLTGWVLHLEPFLIYTALKIDAIIKSLWCLKRLKSRKWIRKIQ